MNDLFARAEALAVYRRGFQLAAASTPAQAQAWLTQEREVAAKHGDAVREIIAEAQEQHETETGRGAWSGEELVDDDF